jgi:hypothetical protein
MKINFHYDLEAIKSDELYYTNMLKFFHEAIAFIDVDILSKTSFMFIVLIFVQPSYSDLYFFKFSEQNRADDGENLSILLV